MSKETVVLAYSGGLDTSVILKWLVLEGYRVVAFVADVGQEEDFDEVRARIITTGSPTKRTLSLASGTWVRWLKTISFIGGGGTSSGPGCQ